MILTKRQKQLYDYLDDYIARQGFAPTLEEIGEHFRLSSLATVHKHLTNLEHKGLIVRKWNFSRAIELVPRQKKLGAVELPLLGLVAAGQPIEALETNDTFTVPEEFIRRQNTFVLRVKGNSMIDDGIWDGDYIIVEERHAAENGETVVALVNGEATVKRLYHEKGGKIRLQPANQTMEPILARAKDVEIRGAVVAVMRKY
ncbi:MAG TPA: transcriptional repressor LexA [Candidatus Margulisiibacteriota bacterium]|nr:transcriptional repressor LexA [Candidatus Margulisiibacteriota bacterium]